mgnify:CR=1 FL=1
MPRDEWIDPEPKALEEIGVTIDETSLRPRTLDDFVGQAELKERLSIILEAARLRGSAADHLLFGGPPGLGKTTLAGIVANELGSHLHITSGPAIERAGDLASILTKLENGDVLFIDEIHRLPRPVEEVLYPDTARDYQPAYAMADSLSDADVRTLRAVLVRLRLSKRDKRSQILAKRAKEAVEAKLGLERVREAPEQYFWTHKRFKTRPPGEPSLYD